MSFMLASLAGGAAKAVLDKLTEDGVQKAVTRAIGMMNDRASGSDLISYSQPARLEPILLLDQRATYVPFVRDVIHTMSNLFTAYFLQSIALDTTISGVKVLKRLDKFNPDRDLSVATRSMLSTESYHNGLPFPGESLGFEAYGPSFENKGPRKPMDPAEFVNTMDRLIQEERMKAGVSNQTRADREKIMQREAEMKQRVQESVDTPEKREARAMLDAEIRAKVAAKYPNDTPEKRLERALQDAEIRKFVEEQYAKNPTVYMDGSTSDSKYSVDTKDVTKMVTDITNLAVGKMIEVTISENGQSAKIPVTVRMRVTGMSPQVMTETLSVGGYDGSFKSRWRQWRAGEIRFWADAVFAMDRIEAHKKAAMRDKSGYYAAVHKRDAKNGLAAAMTGNVSVGTASSIIVMTEQTRKELERNLNRKLSDFRVRQDVFQNTYAMLMVVIDPEWETVTIYHRGIEMPTELTAKDITTSAKGNGPDITEILRMFMEGKAPGRL